MTSNPKLLARKAEVQKSLKTMIHQSKQRNVNSFSQRTSALSQDLLINANTREKTGRPTPLQQKAVKTKAKQFRGSTA